MAMRVIEDECTNCAACEPECPREAISESDMAYVINADACTECEGEGDPKCVDVCPADCIVKA